jgi:hypothetical protein
MRRRFSFLDIIKCGMRVLLNVVFMKKAFLHCTAIGFVLFLLVTLQGISQGRSLDFRSVQGLLDIVLPIVCFSLAVIPFYLLTLKIIEEKQVMNLRVKLIFSLIALTLSTIGLYYDDGPDWKKFLDWGIYVGILIYSFIFFMIMSLAYLFLKRRFD